MYRNSDFTLNALSFNVQNSVQIPAEFNRFRILNALTGSSNGYKKSPEHHLVFRALKNGLYFKTEDRPENPGAPQDDSDRYSDRY